MTADNQATLHKIPERSECVLKYILERQAAEHPDVIAVITEDGRDVTYGKLLRDVRSTAAGLKGLGVDQGQHVLVWLPNSYAALKAWFAINYLGAVYVPMNVAYRGGILEHSIALSDASLAIVHFELMDRLPLVNCARLLKVVALFGDGDDVPGLQIYGATALEGDATGEIEVARPIEPWDAQSIIYTSGTTGPSKGVVSSYAHLFTMSGPQSFTYLTAEDRWLLALPLFHVGGTCFVYAMLSRGASIAIVPGFNTHQFWDYVRSTKATSTLLLGVMAPFLLRAPESGNDRDHTLRTCCMLPLVPETLAFSERFGVEVFTCFNMTETNMPIVSRANPKVLGTCGQRRSEEIELLVVDDHDSEVPPGAVGELLVRSAKPWTMMTEYYKNPEATASAWRNGWFHTGDNFRRDKDGNYFFVDRKKDAIRRRGENVSSFEVENEALRHPSVREAAAVAVPSETSEDEILLVVSLKDGATLAPLDLLRFMEPRMAHFMVPRYIRIVPDLPKTPTNKVQKNLLREDGITRECWDREHANVSVRAQRLKVK